MTSNQITPPQTVDRPERHYAGIMVHTTMAEENLKRLIASVDPAKRPLYVLLPQQEYAQYRAAWKLP